MIYTLFTVHPFHVTCFKSRSGERDKEDQEQELADEGLSLQINTNRVLVCACLAITQV